MKRTGGFVAVERGGFDGNCSRAMGRARRHHALYALENLRVMMINRIFLERPHHGIVAAEWNEAAAG